MAVHRDEHRMTKELQVSTILDTVMDGIVCLNGQQQIVFFNPAAETIFGWKAEQVLGKPVDILVPHRFRELHARTVS